jgi:hypothetical protein
MEEIIMVKKKLYRPKKIDLLREQSLGSPDKLFVVEDTNEARRIMKGGARWAQASGEDYYAKVEQKRYYKKHTKKAKK